MKQAILFITFNRPDLTDQVFQSIKRYKPEKLYISCDGPRSNHKEDNLNCENTKKIVNQVDWNCKVFTKFETKNLGCKVAVSSAISWFFENEDMGIILEDDTLPNDSFYNFCSDLLIKYKDNDRISMISGDNFSFGNLILKESYYYSKYTHIWGWASWRRAWKYYNYNISGDLYRLEELKNFFYKDEYLFWKNQFIQVSENLIDTWDLQWAFTNFINKKLSIMPKFNLVQNLGFRKDATHTSSDINKFSKMEVSEIKFPLISPKKIEINFKADKFSEFTFYQPKRNLLILLKEKLIGL